MLRKYSWCSRVYRVQRRERETHDNNNNNKRVHSCFLIRKKRKHIFFFIPNAYTTSSFPYRVNMLFLRSSCQRDTAGVMTACAGGSKTRVSLIYIYIFFLIRFSHAPGVHVGGIRAKAVSGELRSTTSYRTAVRIIIITGIITRARLHSRVFTRPIDRHTLHTMYLPEPRIVVYRIIIIMFS